MSYYQHKLKCMSCGLHFIVCSLRRRTSGLVHCPECGKSSMPGIPAFLYWPKKVEGFIFEAVPGGVGLRGGK